MSADSEAVNRTLDYIADFVFFQFLGEGMPRKEARERIQAFVPPSLRQFAKPGKDGGRGTLDLDILHEMLASGDEDEQRKRAAILERFALLREKQAKGWRLTWDDANNPELTSLPTDPAEILDELERIVDRFVYGGKISYHIATRNDRLDDEDGRGLYHKDYKGGRSPIPIPRDGLIRTRPKRPKAGPPYRGYQCDRESAPCHTIDPNTGQGSTFEPHRKSRKSKPPGSFTEFEPTRIYIDQMVDEDGHNLAHDTYLADDRTLIEFGVSDTAGSTENQ